MAHGKLSEIFRPELAELAAYTPGKGEYRIRLDANEAPAFLSEAAHARLARAAAETSWRRYPDGSATALRTAIAKQAGVSADEVLVGVGSDELITMLLTACSAPRDKARAPALVTTTPTFVMYRLSARMRGFQVLEVPLDDGWDLASASLHSAIQLSRPNLVFIASPNNPTGTMANRERLVQLIESAPETLFVIDEAYIDYANCHHLDLYAEHPNVVILRTLSKIGFAALRVGWLIGRPEFVRELDKVRLPYNTNSVSQHLATVVFEELGDELSRGIQGVIAERERLLTELATVPSLSVTPSQANFLWFRCQRPSKDVFEGLCARSVLVRSFHARGGRLANQLRVTIGDSQENSEFVRALREVV